MEPVEPKGYIEIHESVRDAEILRDPWYVALLYYEVLLCVNPYKDKITPRGEKYRQLATSTHGICKRTGLTRQQVRTGLKKLQKAGLIEVETSPIQTMITVTPNHMHRLEGDR